MLFLTCLGHCDNKLVTDIIDGGLTHTMVSVLLQELESRLQELQSSSAHISAAPDSNGRGMTANPLFSGVSLTVLHV